MNKNEIQQAMLEAAQAAAGMAETAAGDAGKRLGQDDAIEFAQAKSLAETAKLLSEAAEITSRV